MRTENETKKYYEDIVSAAFRAAFEAREDRESDPGAALEAAREEAAALLPSWMTGKFDDERLVFVADEEEVFVPLKPGGTTLCQICCRRCVHFERCESPCDRGAFCTAQDGNTCRGGVITICRSASLAPEWK